MLVNPRWPETYYVGQSGLQLPPNFLSLPPKCWDGRCATIHSLSWNFFLLPFLHQDLVLLREVWDLWPKPILLPHSPKWLELTVPSFSALFLKAKFTATFQYKKYKRVYMYACPSHFSVAMTKAPGQSNLQQKEFIGAYSSRGLQSMTIMAESIAAGRQAWPWGGS